MNHFPYSFGRFVLVNFFASYLIYLKSFLSGIKMKDQSI